MIDRVEILRGSQSSLYGSSAIGGTINIFTKKGDYKETKINLSGGSNRTDNLDFSTGNSYGNHSYFIGINKFNTDGISAMNDEKTTNDDDSYKNESLIVNYSYQINNDSILTGSLRYVNFNNKAYGILEPGQSKPGSADVYVEGCPQASSWWYNWDGDPTCSRLSAISGFAATEADYPNGSSVLTNYDPKYAHALACLLYTSDAADE